jgi:CubicO group peptidase (beta-lactamase class C family)
LSHSKDHASLSLHRTVQCCFVVAIPSGAHYHEVSIGGPIVLTLLVTLTSIVLSGETSVDDEKLQKRLERLDRSIDDLRGFLKIPGISAAVVKDQRLVWSRGFGQADVECGVPAAPDTPYRIASLTKTFASTLLMQLVEQGKLHLAHPMSKYSPRRAQR